MARIVRTTLFFDEKNTTDENCETRENEKLLMNETIRDAPTLTGLRPANTTR